MPLGQMDQLKTLQSPGDSSCHLNLSRIVLQDKAYNP